MRSSAPGSSSGWQQIHASQRLAAAADHRVLHARAPSPANTTSVGAPASAGEARLEQRDPPVAAARRRAAHVQPPAAVRGPHQRRALERRGAEAVLADPRHRREPLAVDRAGDHHLAAAAPRAGRGRRRRTTRRGRARRSARPSTRRGRGPAPGAATATRPVPGSGRAAAASPACAAAANSARRDRPRDANSRGRVAHLLAVRGRHCVSSRQPAAARDDATRSRRRRVVP